MCTVFISHATQDAQFAHRLADDLQWLDVQDALAELRAEQAGEGSGTEED